MAKHAFQNFVVDHMTLLFDPKLYPVVYVAFKIIFGTEPDDLLYEKRRKQADGKEISMTFAARLGEAEAGSHNPIHTVFAIVQPSEGAHEPSHVRSMLKDHSSVAHLQHIALRTPDLIAFHKHALERGVQFITPILKDPEENLIQVFSGEWFFPGSKATALFFEFVQRNPSDTELDKIQRANKQTWFRDQTFLGLYDEKEQEYRSGKVTSFLPDDIFQAISKELEGKQIWEITEADIARIERLMIELTAKKNAL